MIRDIPWIREPHAACWFLANMDSDHTASTLDVPIQHMSQQEWIVATMLVLLTRCKISWGSPWFWSSQKNDFCCRTDGGSSNVNTMKSLGTAFARHVQLQHLGLQHKQHTTSVLINPSCEFFIFLGHSLVHPFTSYLLAPNPRRLQCLDSPPRPKSLLLPQCHPINMLVPKAKSPTS